MHEITWPFRNPIRLNDWANADIAIPQKSNETQTSGYTASTMPELPLNPALPGPQAHLYEKAIGVVIIYIYVWRPGEYYERLQWAGWTPSPIQRVQGFYRKGVPRALRDVKLPQTTRVLSPM